jgi:glycosyltransferase involved in cell wall biosynthesis
MAPVMKVAIVTDAWRPQINGVVTTLSETQRALQNSGHEVAVLSPDAHRTVPCPTYPEIRLALWPRAELARRLDAFAPDAIHVATEGPLGIAARAHCVAHGLAFTTSYHTQFPQYLRKRFPIPESWSYAYLRRHHGAARRTLVATEQLRRDLAGRGFANVVIWPRGVDTSVFRPSARDAIDAPRPIWIYAGRVAVEKNLDAFLSLDLPGTKVVVGDGPDRSGLEAKYRNAKFTGYKFGAELASHLSSADVFVFPSRTDTFGLVMLEAIACGTPVAAYPVTGPLDVIGSSGVGALDEDLQRACLAALKIPRGLASTHAAEFSWANCAKQFAEHLRPVRT